MAAEQVSSTSSRRAIRHSNNRYFGSKRGFSGAGIITQHPASRRRKLHTEVSRATRSSDDLPVIMACKTMMPVSQVRDRPRNCAVLARPPSFAP